MKPMPDVSVPIAVEEIQPVTQPTNPTTDTDTEQSTPLKETVTKTEDTLSHPVELPAVYTTDPTENLKPPNNTTTSNDIAHLIA